jgi:hypothetical protein
VTSFADLRKSIHSALEEARSSGDATPVSYAPLLKSLDDERRYTLGPLYVPGATDADDEYVTAEDLQSSMWNYVRKGKRDIRDTHTDRVIGELVEIVTWPYEVETDALLGDGTFGKFRLPANTVYAGVVWGPEAWALVKSRKLRGYSMGGRAVRVKDVTATDMPKMRDFRVEDVAQKSTAPQVTKDAPVPINVGDRVAWSNDDLTLGMRGRVVKTSSRDSDGAVVHDILWDDGYTSDYVPGFSLRNLSVKDA